MALSACSSSSPSSAAAVADHAPQQLTLYTSVTQNTVTAVVDGFTKADPGVKVSVFRATTGQLNARIAADQHSGGLRAGVIWGTDPLSMESYAQRACPGRGRRPAWPACLPRTRRRTSGYRELYLVIVAHKGLCPRRRHGRT